MAVDPYQAARSGDLAGLRAYAAGGGELDARRPGQLQRTPLHVAIESGQPGAARLLIELGADIHAADYRDARPLHYAAQTGLLAIVELLLDRGAEPAALNCFGETALHRLAAGGGLAPEEDQVRIARRLVAAGVPADGSGNAGRTPLWYAAARGKALVAAALLAAGADPARRADGDLGSPADVATGAVALLLRHG
jgi:ankyrin repeat protein